MTRYIQFKGTCSYTVFIQLIQIIAAFENVSHFPAVTKPLINNHDSGREFFISACSYKVNFHKDYENKIYSAVLFFNSERNSVCFEF